jgi:MFS family permease
MILYGLAGSSGLYLESVGAILAGRALLGVAVAGIMTSATTLIADYYDGPARSRFMGWQAAFMNFGGVVFLTAGGALAERGWRWPFAIYLSALLMVPLALSALSGPKKIPGITETIKTGNNGKATADSSRLLIFIYAIVFSAMVVFYFIPLHIPYYLEKLANAGPTLSGMAIALATFCGAITSFSYGKIRSRLGYLPILGLIFGLMGTGYLTIALSSSYPVVLAGLAVSGLGMGLMFPNMNVWLTTEVSPSVRGRAIGGFTTAVFLGQFVSPFAGQPIVDQFGLVNLFGIAGILMLNLALAFVIWKKQILDSIMQVKKEPIVETVSVKTRSRKISG